MATVVIPERFAGKYDGVTPAAMLPPGSISGGKNMRKVSQGGGWKVRKGCALHDDTALGSGAGVKSLHYYKNPFPDNAGDYNEHFIAQCNSKLYRESGQDKLPPTTDSSFGTDLGVTVGTTPGFSAYVSEYFFYADGSGRPVVWGGANPRVKGCFIWDDSESAFGDYSRKVADGRSDTQAIVLEAAGDHMIVLTEEKAAGLVFALGSGLNSNTVGLTVQAWRSGTWTGVSNLSDGTETGGDTTLAQDGTVTWDRSTSDTLYSYRGIQGYAYKIGWDGALSNSVHVLSLEVIQAADLMTNKWNGEMNWVTGCRFFDVSIGTGEMQESLGKVTNESTSMYADISSAQTGDFLYIKTPEPATIFGIGIVTGYSNTNDAQIDRIEYWNGSSWVALSTNLDDDTLDSDADSSFSQTGTFAFDGGAASPERRIFSGDTIPGYWYRLSWDAALSANTRIYAVVYGSLPDLLPAYSGCVEFKNRLFVWGDPEFPNRLRYSARANPFCFSGLDSGYTDAFGAKDTIICAIKFYNELIVFKKHSVHLLEGDSPGTFGTLKITDKVGLASPKSAQVAEVGFPASHRDEPMTIAIWQDIDGVYTFDGRKTKKESYSVDNYFNPESSDCVAAVSIRNLQAFADPNNNEYHLLLPTVELVFNYITAEWYPAWERKIALTTGLDFRAYDNRHYTYGASDAGWIMKLEIDTTDKTVADVDIAIEHSVKSRAIGYEKAERLVRFSLTKLWAELKARIEGSIVTKTFKNLASNGVLQITPQAMTMVSPGYNIVEPMITCKPTIEDCKCFQIEFSLNTMDQEMEIYGFVYEVAGAGLSEQ